MITQTFNTHTTMNRITKFLALFLISGLILFNSCNSADKKMSENYQVDPYMERTTKHAIKEEMAEVGDEEMVEPEEPVDPDQVGDSTNFNTEEYGKIIENPFLTAQANPLSTFSIDVDNASYSNIRRYLQQWNQLPPNGGVRLEEMINYFDYDYPQPKGKHPFSINTEISAAPWNKDHQLIHIGLQGKDLDYNDIRPSNLVFLVDCSGSMSDQNKLPLMKKALGRLLDQLDDKDKVAIVAYAGAAGLVLPSTPASQKSKILKALNRLESGGSTAGGQGIELAYKVALDNLIKDGNNRVILATDGDFNVGTSSTDALVDLIEEKRKQDIFLTICGLGMGNYKDDRMEQISNAGNGNYFYIDNMREAEKVFVREMRANMFTIAKDVKIQIEFNPNLVKAYRLIGYENRMLKKEDFDDDTKDAGELGAGHTVTAIYEIIPVGSASKQNIPDAPKLKYQNTTVASNQTDLMTVKFRYKQPKADKSILLEQVLTKGNVPDLANTSNNFRFSAAVAGFGMLLRDSEFSGDATFDGMAKLAQNSMGEDPHGDRAEFIQLIRIAEGLKKEDRGNAEAAEK
jgi:Ca-activated chloride channel family protein